MRAKKTFGIGIGSKKNTIVIIEKKEDHYLWTVQKSLTYNDPEYHCPFCNVMGFTEDALWEHWVKVHGRQNVMLVCPICVSKGKDKVPVGDSKWGFSNHLFHNHGPRLRLPKPPVREKAPTYSFALVVCQHPNGDFLLVEEGCNNGWWLPAGRVDPGESFHQAALREVKEEAGIDVTLKGILRVEYSPFRLGGARQRVVFYAVPTDPDQKPKSEPDYESMCAVWISYDQLQKDVTSSKKRLRGSEPFVWFGYVHKRGTIYPLSLLKEKLK
eukprot:TRINITY_DN4148_c0_g1_i1.p1 TRINITY_DN4148_c0_g1~~TRINITY_DN4148_c0_g1_i1.p1  ORF type:complete len:270 (+),score=62.36 TRINITY_DN4148_c0_g1_i1:338-1147(+)